MSDAFLAEDYRYTAGLLREGISRGKPDQFRAVCSNNLNIILSALDRAGSPWQPIETAPRDGTFVLCALPSGHITVLQYARAGHWRRDVFSELSQHPTHWIPLPESPT